MIFMDKIYSTIFGAVVGDALGMPTENLSKDEILFLYGKVVDYVEPKNYLAGKLKKGEWTDDTEQAICLMKSLEKNGVNLNKFAKNLIEWFKTNPPDIGYTSLKAIMKLMRGDFSGLDSESCGAAMRIYPIPLYYNDLNTIKREVIKSSKITHNNNIAIAGALAISYIIYKEEKDIIGCCKFIENISYKFSKLLLKIEDFNNVDEAYDYFGTGVSTLQVVPSAIATFILTDNFEEGMIKAINAGGDTDTLASIYGALAGSYYNKVPKKWIDGLKDKDKIKKIIEEVYKG